jgi:hypothetical protein
MTLSAYLHQTNQTKIVCLDIEDDPAAFMMLALGCAYSIQWN